MSEGWIKLHRKLVDNPLWTSEKFTKAQAWIDIIMDANHSPGHFFVRGVRINTGRGQTGRSELTLSKKWKWSRDKVRRFLKWLVSERMITLKQDNKTTIITVCNYEQYQTKKNDNDTPNDTPNKTTSNTPNDTQTRITKNEKNKGKSENEFSDESLEMKISKYLFSVLLKSDQNNKKPDFQKWCSGFDKILRIDSRTKEDIRRVIDYAHDPKNVNGDFSWVPNVRSPDKVRKHFTALLIQCNKIKPTEESTTMTAIPGAIRV